MIDAVIDRRRCATRCPPAHAGTKIRERPANAHAPHGLRDRAASAAALSRANVPAVGGRSRGSLASVRSSTSLIAGGRLGRVAARAGGGWCLCAYSFSTVAAESVRGCTRQRVKEHAAERVHVGAPVDRGARGLLGGHVVGVPTAPASDPVDRWRHLGAGDAEVGDVGMAGPSRP